jgi:hypothetical protein
MEPAELHKGLQQLMESSSTKLLVLDIRPMEDFVQGHLVWKKVGSGLNGGEGSGCKSGVLHLEPEWLKEG